MRRSHGVKTPRRKEPGTKKVRRQGAIPRTNTALQTEMTDEIWRAEPAHPQSHAGWKTSFELLVIAILSGILWLMVAYWLAATFLSGRAFVLAPQ